jgi:glycosyltransferase involved in cell wall biosynthesis
MDSWGGGEQVLLNLAKSIAEYEIIIASPPGDSLNIFKKNHIKVYEVKSLKKLFKVSADWQLNDKLIILLRIISSLPTLLFFVKHEKIDLILANGNFAALYAVPLSKISGVKFFIIQHFIYHKNSTHARITSYLAKYAQKLICVSNAMADTIKSIVSENFHEKILVIYNGIVIPKDYTKKNNADKTVINIGIVCSILRWKGIDQILEALSPTLTKREDIVVSIIGSTTTDPDSEIFYDELKNYIQSHNFEKKIKFLGAFDTKSDIYFSLDIVINYSRDPESFSLTVAEAMSFGKIVIGPQIGGPSELIENGSNGFLCEPNNPDKLNDIVEYCIDNFHSEEFIVIKRNARKRIIENFSIDNLKNNYLELFRTLI